jgi:hypothetical protein
MNLPFTLEVMNKLKCGQNIFRRPLIEKAMAEVGELAKKCPIEVEPLPEIKTQYYRPILTAEEKAKVQEYAKKAMNSTLNYASLIVLLCAENMTLVKEVNEHRAARGIEPLPTFEV